MAKFDFGLIEQFNTENKDEENTILEKMDNESELSFYNRKAVALVKELIRKDQQCEEIDDEFVDNIKTFRKEWQEVMDNDPLIGKNAIRKKCNPYNGEDAL
ncbi:MAG: hypothetical protein LIR46_12780 [Bacteroidota bacterium]|nr:hypothetical protein [Bacteroidota bacterium]